MKKNRRLIISSSLIIGGVMLLSIAFIIKRYTRQANRQHINSYYQGLGLKRKNDAVTVVDIINYAKDETSREDFKIYENTIEEGGLSIYQEGDVLGIIKIPKIDVEVALCQGTTKQTLKYAVGHFAETAYPGEVGNCAIIGHRNYTYGEFFNRLDELEVDDLIEVLYNNEQFTYQVTGKKVVEPTQLEVLDQGEEKALTLITCTPIRVATHRLIVSAILVESEANE